MRMSEIKRGIKVYDIDGEEMGVSKESARRAVLQTSFSRMVLSFPIFILPGVTMAMFERFGMIPKARVPKTLLEVTVIAFALWIALPISVSLFPQRGSVRASEMEQEFRTMTNSKGKVVDTFYYNKGL